MSISFNAKCLYISHFLEDFEGYLWLGLWGINPLFNES